MKKETSQAKSSVILKEYLHPFFIFVSLAALIIIFNSFDLWTETLKIRTQRKQIPFYFSGFKFLGLEGIFRNVAYVGYYTDKDFSDKQNAAQFAEAQYILAPTILDLNNADHEFILFDCTTDAIALKMIKEIGAIPLKKNSYGIILAKRGKWKSFLPI